MSWDSPLWTSKLPLHVWGSGSLSNISFLGLIRVNVERHHDRVSRFRRAHGRERQIDRQIDRQTDRTRYSDCSNRLRCGLLMYPICFLKEVKEQRSTSLVNPVAVLQLTCSFTF